MSPNILASQRILAGQNGSTRAVNRFCFRSPYSKRKHEVLPWVLNKSGFPGLEWQHTNEVMTPDASTNHGLQDHTQNKNKLLPERCQQSVVSRTLESWRYNTVLIVRGIFGEQNIGMMHFHGETHVWRTTYWKLVVRREAHLWRTRYRNFAFHCETHLWRTGRKGGGDGFWAQTVPPSLQTNRCWKLDLHCETHLCKVNS